MSHPVKQRNRLVKLRKIQHRIAGMKVAKAASELANLNDINSRMERMRDKLVIAPGYKTGQSLQGIGEMVGRLEQASIHLYEPIAQAQAKVDELQRLHGDARHKEDSAVKLLKVAEAATNRANELRAAANQPFRKSRNIGRLS